MPDRSHEAVIGDAICTLSAQADAMAAIVDEVRRLRREVEELRQYRALYMEELDKSIVHSHKMMGGLLQVALVPGVIDAIRKHNEGSS